MSQHLISDHSHQDSIFKQGEVVEIYSNTISLESIFLLGACCIFIGIQLDSPRDPTETCNSNDTYKYL